MRRTVVLLALPLGLLVGTAGAAVAAEPDAPRHQITLVVLAAEWDELGDVAPVIPRYDATEIGSFDETGLGLEASWYWRATPGGALSIGGEFGGWTHENRRSFELVESVSGERIRSRVDASAGHLTAGARWEWGRGRARAFAGLGAGVYLVRLEENLEGDDFDFQSVDTGYDEAGPGGYLTMGMRLGGAKLGLHVNAKIHWLAIADMEGAFQGQEPGGPIVSVGTGVEVRFGR